MAALSERDSCPVCNAPLNFFPGIERRADGIPVAIGFRLRCPNPQPIATDTSGWYTQPFTFRQ